MERESTTTMKRNMVPLLAIAFVVAIISTGVFYGLFAGKLRSSSDVPGHAIVVAARDLDRGTVIQPNDVRISEVQGVLGGAFSKPEDVAGVTLLASLRANEPLLEERVSPRFSDAQAAGGPVPTGMRAVSMHVFQSESLLSLLHPGSRVDLQAVSERNGPAELRTVLENVQVLAVSPPDANGNRPAGAVVTVLIKARDTDMVALADAGSRIRVALRNPSDQETTPRHSVALAALFSASNKPDTVWPEEGRGTAIWDHPVQLRVRVLSVSDAALEELRAQTSPVESDKAWRTAAFRSAGEGWDVVRKLEQKHELELISGERLMAGVGRPGSYHVGAQPDELRVQFSPEWLGTNQLRLHVKPRIGRASASDIQFPAGPSFLLESAAGDSVGGNLAAQLFPGRTWEHRHMVIFVSTQIILQKTADAVARNTEPQGKNRGR
jgi:Flp pilus assembly protein CpaB